MTQETLTHDAAGNLSYDGVRAYSYDAWNRLVKITRAFRDPAAPASVTLGSVVGEFEHDGLSRRVVQRVTHSADLDATYRYYHDGQRVIEVRNGSDLVLWQHVWGMGYIDELAQTALNEDPTDTTEQLCETLTWALCDANYNVMMIVDASGAVAERYEYSPYGQRTVYISPGANDPEAHAPTAISRRYVTSDAIRQPWGLNPIGHQGLSHDEAYESTGAGQSLKKVCARTDEGVDSRRLPGHTACGSGHSSGARLGGTLSRSGSRSRKRFRAGHDRPSLACQSAPLRRRFIGQSVIAVLAAVLIVCAIAWSSGSSSQPTPGKHAIGSAIDTPPLVTGDVEPRSLHELLALPVERLASVDIARMNLLCAAGLPGAEGLDIQKSLDTLDKWAGRVRSETDRHLYRVTDPGFAAHYRHSEPYFRAEFLLQVLQEDLGIKYAMTAANDFSFEDSRVAFLHGMIPGQGQTSSDTTGGTCASMPVMYVAIGRRLGYPLKLVTTDAHLFVRWDGRDHPNPAWRERFNIEGAGQGFASHGDEYYKTWPFPVSDSQAQSNGYLLSLTAKEELATFLAARGHCGVDMGQLAFAARAYEDACRYDPRRPAYRSWLVDAAARSGYRPVAPALAKLVDRHSRNSTGVQHPMPDTGVTAPRASSTVDVHPSTPHIPRIEPWRGQHPTTPVPGAASPRPPSRPQSHQLPGSPP